MERALASIFGKSNDFKVCKSCNRINFYENENCICCGEHKFVEDNKKVLDVLDEEYQFYQNEFDYTEEEIDNIYIEV